jgi:hypothetical protein
VVLKRVIRQVVYPIAIIHQRDEFAQHILISASFKGAHAAHNEQLRLCTGKRHVDTSPVFEQISDIARVVASYQAQHDDFLVSSLKAIRRVHFHARKVLEFILQEVELRTVMCHNTNFGGRDAYSEQTFDKL